tara:strand:- start:656 stop:1117 length:462 start_codon:yes stop_codon:yes gene_type:complete
VSEIPACARLVDVFRLPLAWLSPAVGVGHDLRLGTAGIFPCAENGLFPPWSIARASSSLISPESTFARSMRTFPSFGWPGVAVGVGHDPDPIPSMSRANPGSADATPFRIIPERGQVSEYVSEPPRSESCDVFQHNPSRSLSKVAKASRDLWP